MVYITKRKISRFPLRCQRGLSYYFAVDYANMQAFLLLIQAIALLLWWDLLMKIRLILKYNWCRRYIDRSTSRFANRLLSQARGTVKLRFSADMKPAEEIKTPFLVVANHQSIVDIVAIMAAFETQSVRFVAKKELAYGFPAVSQILRVQRHTLIDRRGNFGEAMRLLESATRRCKPPICPVIFPEGTRSRTGEVMTFHSGAVRRMLQAKPMPMVALAVDGGTKITSVSDIISISPYHRYRLGVVATFPETSDKNETVSNLETARTAIVNKLEEWRSPSDAA